MTSETTSIRSRVTQKYLFALALSILLIVFNSCRSSSNNTNSVSHVYVRLDGVTQSIKSLRVHWKINGNYDKRSPFTFNKNLTYFGFDLASPDNHGELAIVVDALDDVCVIMSGERIININSEEYVELTIGLKQQNTSCPVHVDIVGIGNGTVKSEPPGIDCPLICDSNFPVGSKVKLTALPSVVSSPINWSGDCIGGAGCEVIADKLRTVRIDFTPRICSVAGSGWCQEAPYPVIDTLNSGWIDSKGQVYIVGGNGTIIRSIGNVWASQRSETINDLLGVFGLSDDDIWAVGKLGIIRHWDGGAWNQSVSPTNLALYSVWGTQSDDVWAVGEATTILHWNGISWTPYNLGLPSRDLRKLWGSGSKDIWAAGDSGMLLHWDGSQWKQVASGTSRVLFDIWGSSTDNIWAMGFTSVIRYNGSNWSFVAQTDPLLKGLDHVWGISVNTVWASGSSSDLTYGIWRWDGSNWINSYKGSSSAIVRSLFGDRSGRVYGVGDSGLLLNYDGSRWSQLSSGDIGAGQLYGGWGSDPSNVWTVGGDLTNTRGYIFRNVSGRWLKEAYEAPNGLSAAWGSAADDVWAVGRGGLIIRWNGTTWSTVPSGVTADLKDVSGSSTNNVWAVGAAGTIVRWDGTKWANGGNLVDDLVSLFVYGNEVWVVGINRIHHWNGTAWSSSPATSAMRIHGLDNNTIFAVGDVVSYRWDGLQWNAIPIPAKLKSLTVVSASDIWAAGSSLWHYDGTKWIEADPAVRSMNHIFPVGPKDIFVVGYGGSIQHFQQ